MARSKLENLIIEYGSKNIQCNALKKEVSTLNANLKDMILKANKENSDIEAGDWTCKLVVSQSEDLDEEKVIELLKQYNYPQIDEVVKTKEYLDFDALEKLIYAGDVDTDILADINSRCKTVKNRETLYVKQRKGDK